jgi:hypothetical protein
LINQELYFPGLQNNLTLNQVDGLNVEMLTLKNRINFPSWRVFAAKFGKTQASTLVIIFFDYLTPCLGRLSIRFAQLFAQRSTFHIFLTGRAI